MNNNQPLVMIVDDDENARKILQLMLERNGYRIIQAVTGEDALILAHQHHPDVILLDDVLPGIWGDEVRERLKDAPATANIKIIMHTGRMDKLASYRTRLDIDGVLPKPSRMPSLLETLQNVLTKQPA